MITRWFIWSPSYSVTTFLPWSLAGLSDHHPSPASRDSKYPDPKDLQKVIKSFISSSSFISSGSSFMIARWFIWSPPSFIKLINPHLIFSSSTSDPPPQILHLILHLGSSCSSFIFWSSSRPQILHLLMLIFPSTSTFTSTICSILDPADPSRADPSRADPPPTQFSQSLLFPLYVCHVPCSSPP